MSITLQSIKDEQRRVLPHLSRSKTDNKVEPKSAYTFFKQNIIYKHLEDLKRMQKGDFLLSLPSQIQEMLETYEYFQGNLSKPKIFPEAKLIRDTDERRLVAAAHLFFATKAMDVSVKRSSSHDDSLEEFYTFLGDIPGLTIMERCDSTKDSRRCHTYVFGHFNWYKTCNRAEDLLGRVDRVIKFLLSKGFSQAKTTAVGQIAVYHTETTVHHFAKIVQIDPNGGITLHSKFGPYHIYQHRIGLIPIPYGRYVTFLHPPCFPKFLKEDKRVALQPLVGAKIEEIELLKDFASLISEFVVSKNKVHVESMQTFFQQNTPYEQIENVKRVVQDPILAQTLSSSQMEEMKAILQMYDYAHLGILSKPKKHRGSHLIKETHERRLVATVHLFFTCQKAEYEKRVSSDHKQALRDSKDTECFTFLGDIPNLTIIERCDEMDSRLCYTYIFGDFNWYKKCDPETDLIGDVEKVMTFLLSKGFSHAKTAAVGQVALYHRETTVCHFAKIVKIDFEGEITVRSKWGPGDIYEHRMDIALFQYGRYVVFLDLPNLL